MDDKQIWSNTRHKDRFELLIMSEAGKPIYSLSKREDAVTLMPLCSTLISYAKKAQKQTLLSMKTSDNLIITFTTRPPLIIIVLSEANSYVDPLILIEQVEAQVVSILTAKTLRSVFEERPTFDLKRLLYGSEKLIDSIAKLSVFVTKWSRIQPFLAVTSPSSTATTKPHRALVPIVVMPPSIRDNIHSILSKSNSKNMVFSLLFKVDTTNQDIVLDDAQQLHESGKDNENKDISFKLVTVCNHHSGHKLTVADIHIIFALLDGSKAQLSSVESLWMPVCLPRFNQDAFLHSYISYTNQTSNCLVMLSVDRDEFSSCQESRNNIEDKLEVVMKDQKVKLCYQPSSINQPILQTQKLQSFWYQTNKQVLWWQQSTQESPSPVLYYAPRRMLQSSLKALWLKLADDTVFLGWHVPAFQLYAQFDNSISSNEATEVVQRITDWVKKEEDNFSIKDYR